MKKIIIVLGMPCSGKNTHSKLLASKLNYKYVSLIDILNKEIKEKTKVGLLIKRYVDLDKQVPDEHIIPIIKELIINLKEEGIIFNNFPSTLSQAKALDSFLFARKTSQPTTIILKGGLDKICQRIALKENNNDYNIFKKRMDEFDSKKNIINYYYNAIQFDTTTNSIEENNEEIIKKLEKKCILA